MKYKALIIVAHPDDEIIWMGGMIMKNKDWDWTIYSVCRESDIDRNPKFFKACLLLNARGIISDVDDEKLQPLNEKKLENTILQNLSRKNFDFIFTHGENGEYGHIRHCEIHKAVKKLIIEKKLTCKKLYFFYYNKGKNVPYPRLVPPAPRDDGDVVITLDDVQLALKKKIIREVYGYPNERGFELMSCNKKESFLVLTY